MLRFIVLGLWCVPVVGLAADRAETPARGIVLRNQVVELQPASADGRFRVRAELRVEADLQSADGRHQLRLTAASCNPNDLSLFRNGFEQQP